MSCADPYVVWDDPRRPKGIKRPGAGRAATHHKPRVQDDALGELSRGLAFVAGTADGEDSAAALDFSGEDRREGRWLNLC